VRTVLLWSRRLLVVALVGAVVMRILGSRGRSARGGSVLVPDIGGDTWPPVPVNPAARP